MAETNEKKYLSFEGLQHFWGKVKLFLEAKYVSLGTYNEKVVALEAADKANADAIAEEENRAKLAESGLQTAVEGLNTELGKKVDQATYAEHKTTIDTDIAALKAAVGQGGPEGTESLLDMVSNNTAAIATNADAIETLVGNVAGDNELSVREIAVDEITKQLVNGSASDAIEDLKDIADWLVQHPQDATTMNSDISDLKGRMDTAESNIDGLTERVGTAEGEIDTLQTAVSTLEETVGGLAEGNYATKIETLRTSVGLESDLSYVGEYNTDTVPVTTVKADIAKAKAAIEAEEVRAKEAEQANTTAINGLTERVGTAEGNITDLTSRVGAAEGNINSITDRVDTAEGAIEDINAALDGISTTYVSHEEFEAAFITNDDIDKLDGLIVTEPTE